MAPSISSRTGRLERIGRDVRLLGWRAPVRAGYEVAQRAGLVRVAMGRGASRPPVPLAWSDRAASGAMDIPAAAVARLHADAASVLAGHVRIFGEHWSLDGAKVWTTDQHHGVTWPDERSDRLAFEGPAAPSDPKWVWELGRHRHLVILARAAALGYEPEACVEMVERQLTSFLDVCPPGTGPHWASSLELALRALAWTEVLELTGHALGPDLRDRLASALWRTGRHLVVAFPRTASMQFNNHFLGDAVGMVAVGRLFPGSRLARRWCRLGDALVTQFVRRGVQPDGVTMEDSIGYHRFVLELLAARLVLGDAPAVVAPAAVAMAQALVRMGSGDPGAPVPQFGDWDAGRALVTSAPDPGADLGLSGAARLGLALGGTGAPPEWRAVSDECAWYAPEGEPLPSDAAVVDGSAATSGLARAVAGPWTVTLKGVGGPSHQHADLTSVAIAWHGAWVVGDPGTAHYNEPIAERQWFRTSAAHAVLVLDGEDQLVPDRQFRFVHRAHAVIGPPLVVPAVDAASDDQGVVMWCVHDAYQRLSPPRRVVRAVVVAHASVTVIDVVEPVPSANGRWSSQVTLAPEWTLEGDRLTHPHQRETLAFAHAEANREVVRGGRLDGGANWSTTYGCTVPSERVELSGGGALSAWRVGGPPGEQARGALPGRSEVVSTPGVAEVRFTVDGSECAVVFRGDAVELRVGGSEAHRRVASAPIGAVR